MSRAEDVTNAISSATWEKENEIRVKVKILYDIMDRASL